MTAPVANVVELFVGPDATLVDVYDRYSYALSMLEVGCAFTFTFWHSDEGHSAWRTLIDPVHGVKCGHRITLAIDGDAVLSGVVETTVIGDDFGGRAEPTFVISGRDDLGAAVSWDADPSLTLKGRTLGDAVQAVYSGVGISAEIGASVDPAATVGALRRGRAHRGRAHQSTLRNEAVRASQPRPGERAHQVVERMVRALGYRVWTTPVEGSGRTGVIIDRPRTAGSRLSLLREIVDGRMTDRSNLRAGRMTTSITNVPTVVTVLADGARGNHPAVQIAREVTNGFLLTEEAMARVDVEALTQPRYAQSRNATTPAGAQNEAARMCATANEGFRRYECTVLGHRLDGRLLLPNLTAIVADDLLGVAEPMLLVAVEGSGARDGGQVTRLTLLPEGALSVIPEPEPG